jgi:DNA-binding transcriptional regulator YiaG
VYECPKLPNCAKLREIRSLDPHKYDIDGLVGDICWLCNEKPQGAINIDGTERLSRKVKELRLKTGWTQEDLARHMNVSLSTIQRWESKGGKPTRLAQKALGELLRQAGIAYD